MEYTNSAGKTDKNGEGDKRRWYVVRSGKELASASKMSAAA